MCWVCVERICCKKSLFAKICNRKRVLYEVFLRLVFVVGKICRGKRPFCQGCISEKIVYTSLFAPGFCGQKDCRKESFCQICISGKSLVRKIVGKSLLSNPYRKRVFIRLFLRLGFVFGKICRKRVFLSRLYIRKEFGRKDCRKESLIKSVSQKSVTRVFCVVCVGKIVENSLLPSFAKPVSEKSLIEKIVGKSLLPNLYQKRVLYESSALYASKRLS